MGRCRRWDAAKVAVTNGLLRQYLPKRTDLHPDTQADLDALAAQSTHGLARRWGS